MKTQLNKGFTLVELMVVVAIIGLLSAVAVPNFKKYQAKAKTSEAKLQLSAIYMSMQSFNMDYNVYGACLNHMGYDPSREVQNRYYTVGFVGPNDQANDSAVSNAQAPAACGGVNGSVRTVAQQNAGPVDNELFSVYSYNAGKEVNTVLSITTWLPATALVAASPFNTFIAGAVGVISSDNVTNTNSDQWTIDQNKMLTQVRTGF